MNTNIIQTNKNEIVAVDNYNPDFGNIRNIEIDGQVWLCGLDVCDALGYVNPSQAIKSHVKEADLKKFDVRSHGQMRKMTFINSHGFYDLCVGSTFPSALDIKDWIKAKFFTAVENNNLPAVVTDDLVNNETFIEAVSDKVMDVLAEDAAKYRAMKGSKSLLSMKEIADTLALPGIGRTNLFKILRKKEMINERNEPYRLYVERGWFKAVPCEYTTKSGVHIKFTTKATILGLENIHRLLKEWGYC